MSIGKCTVDHNNLRDGVCKECGWSYNKDSSVYLNGTTLPGTVDLGRKFDGDKPRWDLVPFEEFSEVADILTSGAKKYAPDNWKYVDDAGNRYFSALMRHIISWRNGEKKDPESGKSHLAHAICSLLFLMWFDKGNKVNKDVGATVERT